jgi:hypothetical protein
LDVTINQSLKVPHRDRREQTRVDQQQEIPFIVLRAAAEMGSPATGS